MKSSDRMSQGPAAEHQAAPEQQSQTNLERWANRTAWGLILRGLGLVAIYNVSRGIANNFNKAMGGSPADYRRKTRDE